MSGELDPKFVQAQVEFLTREVAGLKEVLEARRELDLAQGARILELERELGETQARLRASQREVERQAALLNGYAGKTVVFPPTEKAETRAP